MDYYYLHSCNFFWRFNFLEYFPKTIPLKIILRNNARMLENTTDTLVYQQHLFKAD